MKVIICHDKQWVLIYSKTGISDAFRDVYQSAGLSVTVILQEYKG